MINKIAADFSEARVSEENDDEILFQKYGKFNKLKMNGEVQKTSISSDVFIIDFSAKYIVYERFMDFYLWQSKSDDLLIHKGINNWSSASLYGDSLFVIDIGAIYQYDCRNAKLMHKYEQIDNVRVKSIRILANDGKLFYVTYNRVMIWNYETYALEHNIQLNYNITAFKIYPAANYVYIVSDGMFSRISLADGKLDMHKTEYIFMYEIFGDYLYTYNLNGYISKINIETFKKTRIGVHPDDRSFYNYRGDLIVVRSDDKFVAKIIGAESNAVKMNIVVEGLHVKYLKIWQDKIYIWCNEGLYEMILFDEFNFFKIAKYLPRRELDYVTFVCCVLKSKGIPRHLWPAILIHSAK